MNDKNHWKHAIIFRGIKADLFESLAEVGELKHFAKDSFIIKEGDKGKDFFVVEEGVLIVRKAEKNIAEKKLSDHFGLMAVIEDTVRSADIVAGTDCKLMSFNWEMLKKEFPVEFTELILTNHLKGLQKNIRDMNQTLITTLMSNEKLIDQVSSIREKISSDLHDDVGSILAGLSMQSELLLMQGMDQMNGILTQLGNSSKEAMTRLRDIVWVVDSRKDKFENLFLRMRDFTFQILSEDRFTTSFNLNEIEKEKFIKPEIRENIYFIFKEALTNIVKHSNGDQVHIEIKETDDFLILSISDNGTNREQSLSDGLGLNNMKTRAQRIDGILEFDIEKEFKIKLSIPLSTD